MGAGPLAMMPASAPLGVAIAADGLMVIGMVGCCLALTSLGRHFGIRPSARGVVTSGLYAHIRHPLYVFEMLVQLGTLLMVLSPLAIALYAAFVLFQYARTAQEERVLGRRSPNTAPIRRVPPGSSRASSNAGS
jgi:protein-S-isoprenylcysteine O-methyltransferase Ste14